MSRVAKNPVAIPQGVEVMISDAEIAVKGLWVPCASR